MTYQLVVENTGNVDLASLSLQDDLATQYGAAFVRAHNACGMATSLKHFPGHGSSGTDSHKGLADITDTWATNELEPYQYGRNRTLFPWMPAWEDRPDITMMRYGGIEPTLTASLIQRVSSSSLVSSPFFFP